MRKIMTLLLVALLAFSLIITFVACNDDEDISKGNPNSNSSTEGTTEKTTDSSTTTKANTSETTGSNTSETTGSSSSETTGSSPSETTGQTQKPNLNPVQTDTAGGNFNPARPL